MSIFQEGVSKVAHAILTKCSEKEVWTVANDYASRIKPTNFIPTAEAILRKGKELATSQLLKYAEDDGVVYDEEIDNA